MNEQNDWLNSTIAYANILKNAIRKPRALKNFPGQTYEINKMWESLQYHMHVNTRKMQCFVILNE